MSCDEQESGYRNICGGTEKKILSHGFNVPYQQNLTREEQPPLSSLCGYNHNIIIKQGDKGSAVDVIDRDVYIEKARRQLSDFNVYTPLNVNPTEATVQKINERIQESFNKGDIDEGRRENLLALKDTRPARFYLLPKLRKQGVPGRPVISGCSTSTENKSEFVNHQLSPLVPSIKSYIKDTNDFLRKLSEVATCQRISFCVPT